jgi:hypothetical protein
LLTHVLSHLADRLILSEYLIQAIVEFVDDPPPVHRSLRFGHLRHSLSQGFTINPELSSGVCFEVLSPATHIRDREVHRLATAIDQSSRGDYLESLLEI